MISKQKIKFISSLRHNKYRLKFNCFTAEGEHVVNAFIQSSFQIESIFATKKWIGNNVKTSASLVTQAELRRISSFKNPSNVLAVIVKPDQECQNHDFNTTKPIILLDSISDPGNMGSIIRTADWFGINALYLSDGCVDVFNPKVVQSTMGSLARVNTYRVNANQFLHDLKKHNILCYGACLSGKSIYKLSKASKSAIVFGSESHGISLDIQQILDEKILIPGENKQIDSLNVAVAFGIILSEFV